MGSTLLGFNDYADDVVFCNPSSSASGYKLVPWLNWEEWDTVRVSLFSSSHNSISSALNRVATWRSRGCLPVVVEVTASLIEIHQKDPYFRVDVGNKTAPESEEILAMLYCIAIMRLVNGVVEKTRKKTEISIGEAAEAINIPRVLIDIRHECSHRDLPSLRLVRLASAKALDWLKSYYWEPQKEAIQLHRDGASRIRKDINSKLCELAFFLNTKQVDESGSPIKRKWIQPCGRNKLLSLMAGKQDSPRISGPKKQIGKAMKNLLRIYFSHSSEVASVVVELLLKESSSSDVPYPDDDSVEPVQSVFDDWKPSITKLSNREPEFLLTLIKTVHEMIEIQEAKTYRSGENISEDTAPENHTDRLSDLFAWLVTILKGLKPVCKKESPGVEATFSADAIFPKSTLFELLRKSLLVSCPGNSQLRCSALVLGNMVGNNSLVEKLNKLLLLSTPDPNINEENSSIMSSENVFIQQESYINQAANKLANLKHQKLKRKRTDGAVERSDGKRWVVVKKWNKCPIGMLPLGAASSGLLPTLEREIEEQGSLVKRNLKRKPDCDVEFLNEFNRKKPDIDDSCSKGVRGKLMIGGVWKNVEEEELLAIAANVKVLV